MANYLKLFEDENAYSAFTGTSAYVTPNVSYCSGGSNSLFYNPYVPHDYSKDCFTTVAKSDGIISFSGSTTANILSCSTDNGTTWSTVQTVEVNAGDKVLWKGECTPNSSAGIGKFTSTATFDIEGNVMSLLYGDNFKGQTSLEGKNYAFNSLFTGNTNVSSAENLSLPATTLAIYCYSNMFAGCTSLTTAPALPAMTLATYCYCKMLSGCTSLTTAPELPSRTLAQFCYQNMFAGCTSLTTAPELPATTLASSCYHTMFYNCTSLNSITCLATNIGAYNCTYNWVYGVPSGGTFTKATSTRWSTGTSGIPSGWTVNNK